MELILYHWDWNHMFLIENRYSKQKPNLILQSQIKSINVRYATLGCSILQNCFYLTFDIKITVSHDMDKIMFQSYTIRHETYVGDRDFEEIAIMHSIF